MQVLTVRYRLAENSSPPRYQHNADKESYLTESIHKPAYVGPRLHSFTTAEVSMAHHVAPILCGVDVSLATLDIAQTDQPVQQIPNTPEAIKSWLESLPVRTHIAVEATGRYHEQLLIQAMEAGHEVFVINGKQLSHYREAVGPRAKTDPGDARLLLRYLTHEQAELRPAKALNGKEKRIWSLLQRRATLVKARSQLTLSLRGDPETEGLSHELVANLNRAIAQVEKIMIRLARELGWQDLIKRCQTIPGVGELSALALVTCFHRGDFKRSDQWIAYLGLDVRVRDSGRSRGRRKLSKRGNPEVRRLLFNGAMSAVKMPCIRPRYEAYRSRGLSSTAALVTMSRKLARIAFAILTRGGVYDANMPGWACSSP